MSQLLIESSLLAVIAAALGIASARILVPDIQRLNVDALPRMTDITVDGRILIIAAAIPVLTSLLFGMVPALRGVRRNLVHDIKKAAPSAAARADRHPDISPHPRRCSGMSSPQSSRFLVLRL